MNKILMIGSLFLTIIFTGCTSTDVTYTKEENDNIKNYIQFTNTYVQYTISQSDLAPRVFAQPYRSRYRLVKQTLK